MILRAGPGRVGGAPSRPHGRGLRRPAGARDGAHGTQPSRSGLARLHGELHGRRRRAGRGVGRALSEYTLSWAREQGYAAMQFNAVAESNHVAVRLWQALGFRIIGTVPEAFEHPTLGRIGLHIMHRCL